MKKNISKWLAFLFVLVCLDMLCGWLFHRLLGSAKSGDTARNEYIANSVDAPVLVFGSSRALHHYVSQIIGDSLKLNCYNCGQNGMGIILFYGRYKMITKRYIPKIIIYDVLSGFDIEKNDNYSYLTWLKPYYDRDGIDSIFWSVEPNERYKMCSQMYRFNGKCLQIFFDNVKSRETDTEGYSPLYGMMNYEPTKTHFMYEEEDSLKMYYWNQFIKECIKNGTKLIFAMSPLYNSCDSVERQYSAIYKLSKKYDIPILNHMKDKDIDGRREYFMDSYHMNNLGAEFYSKKIIKEIRKLL